MINGEKIVRANGVDLCVQTFGDWADPAILLIHRAATSMLGWEDEFCERLAADSRFVIRYDHRDTGRSVSYQPGAPPYTMRDLTADAVGLLDAFDLGSAHLVGRSMGGGIAMLAALDYPDRVASLTLVATSPGGQGLPPMSEEFLAYISEVRDPDWSDREAMIDHVIGLLRVYSGGSGYFDEAAMRELVGRDVDRTSNIVSSQTNHFAIDVAEPFRDRLGEIRAPTLVVHGTEDHVFPLGHALALEKEISGARLLTLQRTGHELPPALWDVVVPAILRHTSGGGRDEGRLRSWCFGFRWGVVVGAHGGTPRRTRYGRPGCGAAWLRSCSGRLWRGYGRHVRRRRPRRAR
jgi:pimeloyl-ACP methyl ester carboxylesterase